jgi:hypothetical protein
MIKYDNDKKYAMFNGLRFVRDDTTGYYLNSKTHERLHRAVWEFCNGPIPQAMAIHHKDFDKGNNDISNLELITSSTHMILHGERLTDEQREQRKQNLADNARPAALLWHGSDNGREWHKKHYEIMKDKLYVSKKFVCEQCGKEFLSTKAGSRFCTNVCKSAWRRSSGIDNEVRKCEQCGKEFDTNKYTKQRCCSRSCSNRARKIY